MAAKSKSRKHIYRKGAEKKAKKGFTKRYGKKKSEYVYGATVGIKDQIAAGGKDKLMITEGHFEKAL